LWSAIIRVVFIFRSAVVDQSRARAHRRNGILMVQATEDRFREHERIRRQSMSGFGLRDYRNCSWRIRYPWAQPAVRSAAVVQLDNQTPMVANCESLSIHGIRRLGVTFGSAQRRFAMTERFSIA
jgi:hypothetical protein